MRMNSEQSQIERAMAHDSIPNVLFYTIAKFVRKVVQPISSAVRACPPRGWRSKNEKLSQSWLFDNCDWTSYH